MGEIYRSLYSVIPARVRDDHTLRPNAKLLYGELSALAQAEGYCWAWNARLAETLGISKRTVEDLLRQLRDRGHIQMEVERDPDSQEVLRRKIWICGPPGVSVPPPRDFTGRVPVKSGDLPVKMAERIIQVIVQKKIPPIIPPKGKRRRGNASGQTSPRRLRTGSRNASPPSGRPTPAVNPSRRPSGPGISSGRTTP